MHVKEIHMARKRPRRSECGGEQRFVSVAAADRDKEGLHAGAPLNPRMRLITLMLIKGGAAAGRLATFCFFKLSIKSKANGRDASLRPRRCSFPSAVEAHGELRPRLDEAFRRLGFVL